RRAASRGGRAWLAGARWEPIRRTRGRRGERGAPSGEVWACTRPGHACLTANGASFHAMGTVYAITNQKGGVGKTTTAVNVGACIAEAGYATLLVDVDPQANATVGLGIPRIRVPGLYEVLSGAAGAHDALCETAVPGLTA